MYREPLFPPSNTATLKNPDSNNYPDVKTWVIKAVAEEEGRKSNIQLWKKEPTAESQKDERLRRIKFLRKYEKHNPLIKIIADRLERCERNQRCCSGACPACGRLLQRWFVRKSKAFIRNAVDRADHDLVAITIIPSRPIIKPGQLKRVFQ